MHCQGEGILERFFKFPIGMLVLLCCLSNPLPAQKKTSARADAMPIRVKVVVVSMFEAGEDTGDTPGEYQLWVEREHLDRIFPLPAGFHHIRMNKDGVLGLLTGVATAKAAASVMALGLDPRFDLSKAYWVIAGIGGGDPADVSLGSAVWANHVIDGDLAYEIDARRYDFQQHVLARRAHGRMGQPVDTLLHGRPGQLYDCGHGRYWNVAGANLPGPGRARGPETRACSAHGE
jgi:purine nucleoside permease